MNKENIKLLRDTIAKIETPFNMNMYDDDCGTPLCIAGHAAWFFREEDEDELLNNLLEARDSSSTVKFAEQWLGLDEDEAHKLFHPNNSDANFRVTDDKSPQFIDKKRAVAQLDYLMENGFVDETWSL